MDARTRTLTNGDDYNPPRRLLGPDGRPITHPDGRDGFPIPYNLQQVAYPAGISRTYWHDRWDEARRHSRENAMVMERDCFLESLLQERRLATASLPWHVQVDNEKDPYQKALKDGMQRILRATPWLTRMHFETLRGVFWGRSANQRIYEWREIDVPDVNFAAAMPAPAAPMGGAPAVVTVRDVRGRCMTVAKHQPVHGDSIGHKLDGRPYIIVNNSESHKIAGAEITTVVGAAGRGVVLQGQWRERFVLYSHESRPAEFFDWERAEAVHGLGLRDVLYWHWWMKTEFMEWLTSYYERVGLGVSVWLYEAGNDASYREVQALAKAQDRKTNIFVPWYATKGGQGVGGLERIETPVAGAEALRILLEYFDAGMERYVVGQSMSSGADNESGLGGTGRANFAANTKYNLVRYDSENLAECYTQDWVKCVQRWTYPELRSIPCRWQFNVPDPDAANKLAGVQTAISFGVDFVKDEVRGLTGMSDPQPGDDVIGGVLAPVPGEAPPGGKEGEAEDDYSDIDEAIGEPGAEQYARRSPERYALPGAGLPPPEPPAAQQAVQKPAPRPMRVSLRGQPPLHAAPVPMTLPRQPGQAAGVHPQALAAIHKDIDAAHPPVQVPQRNLTTPHDRMDSAAGNRAFAAEEPSHEQVLDPASGEWKQRPYSGHTPHNYMTRQEYDAKYGAGPGDQMREAMEQEGLLGGLSAGERQASQEAMSHLPGRAKDVEITDPQTGERVRKPIVIKGHQEENPEAAKLKKHLDEIPGLAQFFAHRGNLSPQNVQDMGELVKRLEQYPHLARRLLEITHPDRIAPFLAAHERTAAAPKVIPVPNPAKFLAGVQKRPGQGGAAQTVEQMELPKSLGYDKEPPRPGEMLEFRGPKGELVMPAQVMKVEDRGNGWGLTVQLDHERMEWERRFKPAYELGHTGKPSVPHGLDDESIPELEKTLAQWKNTPGMAHNVRSLEAFLDYRKQLDAFTTEQRRYFDAGRSDAENLRPHGHSAPEFALPEHEPGNTYAGTEDTNPRMEKWMDSAEMKVRGAAGKVMNESFGEQAGDELLHDPTFRRAMLGKVYPEWRDYLKTHPDATADDLYRLAKEHAEKHFGDEDQDLDRTLGRYVGGMDELNQSTVDALQEHLKLKQKMRRVDLTGIHPDFFAPGRGNTFGPLDNNVYDWMKKHVGIGEASPITVRKEAERRLKALDSAPPAMQTMVHLAEAYPEKEAGGDKRGGPKHVVLQRLALNLFHKAPGAEQALTEWVNKHHPGRLMAGQPVTPYEAASLALEAGHIREAKRSWSGRG